MIVHVHTYTYMFLVDYYAVMVTDFSPDLVRTNIVLEIENNYEI